MQKGGRKMSQENRYKGLCETCKHDDNCTFHRTTELAIIQCEEFETVGSQVARWPLTGRREAPINPIDVAKLGLCANCANVSSCAFPDARNKVMMCEEYTLDESPLSAASPDKTVPEAVAV